MYSSIPAASQSQQPNMASLVYVQNVSPNGVTYYAPAESMMNRPPAPQSQPQPVSFVYATTTPNVQSVPTPPLQQSVTPAFAAKPAPYYVYPPAAACDPNARAGNVVYIVPSASSNNNPQLSMLLQSMSSGQPTFPSNAAAPQMMPTMLGSEYVQVAFDPRVAAPAAPPMLKPAARAALMACPDVCRHYINGRCNRRKCRFLHPDLRGQMTPSFVQYASQDAVGAVNVQPPVQMSTPVHYSSVSSASVSNYNVPPPAPWEQRH